MDSVQENHDASGCLPAADYAAQDDQRRTPTMVAEVGYGGTSPVLVLERNLDLPSPDAEEDPRQGHHVDETSPTPVDETSPTPVDGTSPTPADASTPDVPAGPCPGSNAPVPSPSQPPVDDDSASLATGMTGRQMRNDHIGEAARFSKLLNKRGECPAFDPELAWRVEGQLPQDVMEVGVPTIHDGQIFFFVTRRSRRGAIPYSVSIACLNNPYSHDDEVRNIPGSPLSAKSQFLSYNDVLYVFCHPLDNHGKPVIWKLVKEAWTPVTEVPVEHRACNRCGVNFTTCLKGSRLFVLYPVARDPLLSTGWSFNLADEHAPGVTLPLLRCWVKSVVSTNEGILAFPSTYGEASQPFRLDTAAQPWQWIQLDHGAGSKPELQAFDGGLAQVNWHLVQAGGKRVPSSRLQRARPFDAFSTALPYVHVLFAGGREWWTLPRLRTPRLNPTILSSGDTLICFGGRAKSHLQLTTTPVLDIEVLKSRC